MAAKINEFKNRFDSPIGIGNVKLPSASANKKVSAKSGKKNTNKKK